jgi:hypothetical protein
MQSPPWLTALVLTTGLRSGKSLRTVRATVNEFVGRSRAVAADSTHRLAVDDKAVSGAPRNPYDARLAVMTEAHASCG